MKSKNSKTSSLTKVPKVTFSQKYPHTKRLLIGIILGLIFFSFIIGWPQFTFAYARCGFKMPVMAQPGSTFAGGTGISYYYLPEDGPRYSPGIIKSYYCTTQDAEANNIEPHPLSQESLRRDNEGHKTTK